MNVEVLYGILRRQHDAHRNCREDARTIQRNRRYYLRTHRSVYFENGKDGFVVRVT